MTSTERCHPGTQISAQPPGFQTVKNTGSVVICIAVVGQTMRVTDRTQWGGERERERESMSQQITFPEINQFLYICPIFCLLSICLSVLSVCLRSFSAVGCLFLSVHLPLSPSICLSVRQTDQYEPLSVYPALAGRPKGSQVQMLTFSCSSGRAQPWECQLIMFTSRNGSSLIPQRRVIKSPQQGAGGGRGSRLLQVGRPWGAVPPSPASFWCSRCGEMLEYDSAIWL